jgi:hypothetical protein
MKAPSFFRTALFTIFSFIVMCSMTACAASATQQPAAEQNVPEAVSSGDTAETAATLVPTQAPTQAPTEPPEPTPLPPTATPEPEPVIITAQGFGQDEKGQLGYGFMVENPNQAFGINGTKYTITFYDANGSEIQSKDGYMAALLPGQKLGVGDTAFFGSDIRVDKIEIKLEQGQAVLVSEFPVDAVLTPLVAEKIVYRPAGDQSPYEVVSGVVVNPYDKGLGYTRISFIAYNPAGEIVGGGWDTLGFLTPQGRAGVNADISSSGEVASVEMYPAVNSLWDLFSTEKLPEGAQEPTLLKQGYSLSGDGNVAYGLVIQNPNSNYQVVENIQITFYAEDGSVVGADSDQMTLSPNSTTGMGSFFSIPKDAEISRAEFLINPEIFRESGELPLFTVSNYSINDSGFWKKVTGEVNNPTAADMDQVTVNAVAYNEAGEIIGGGSGRVELVPANGKANLEMTMFTAGPVATVEFYTLYDVE